MADTPDFAKRGLQYLAGMITGSVALLAPVLFGLSGYFGHEAHYRAVADAGFWLAMTTISATLVCGLLQFLRHRGAGSDWAVIAACAIPSGMALWAAINVLCLFRIPLDGAG